VIRDNENGELSMMLAVDARRSFALAAMAAALLSQPALAQTTQEAALPKAEDLLAKMVKSLGGEEAHAKLKNRVTKGSMEFVGMDVTGEIVVKEAAPNLSFVVMTLGELGEMQQGCDGKVLWQLNQMQGPRVMEGEERDAMARQTEFNAQIRWKRLYKEVETVGAETVGDEKCYVVKLTPKDGGTPERWFLSEETGLVLRTELVMKGALGEVRIQSDFDDYKAVDGIKLPHTMTQTAMTMKIRTTVDSIEHNTDLPREVFELPDDVKELLRARVPEKSTTKPAASAPAGRP
jgi:hypothetical protein